MYPEGKAVVDYDVPMTADKPTSMREDLRRIHTTLSEQRKMDAELMERVQHLMRRVERIERTIGE